MCCSISFCVSSMFSSSVLTFAHFMSNHHTINRAAFVCLSVCSPTPPRSFDGSSPNLVGVCRWTSELPLRGSFLKRSTGQRVKHHFFGADDTRLRPHHCKRLMASFAEHGVFCSESNSLDGYIS